MLREFASSARSIESMVYFPMVLVQWDTVGEPSPWVTKCFDVGLGMSRKVALFRCQKGS